MKNKQLKRISRFVLSSMFAITATTSMTLISTYPVKAFPQPSPVSSPTGEKGNSSTQLSSPENTTKNEGTTETDWIFRNLEIQRFNASTGCPTNSIFVIHQDQEGYIWIGTRLGLYRYDGFQMKRYKNDLKRPVLLSSNKINTLADADDYLWIGTDYGLNRLNLKNGESKQYHFDDFPNCDNISKILITKSAGGKIKQMWVGTEGGLYLYEPQTDSFTMMCDQRGNSKVPHCAIKCINEDSKGYVWFGTWDKGLFRYDSRTKDFYAMPKFNDLNSAQTVFEDQKGRLWVGTWGKGIYMIQNPHDTNKPLKFINFMSENTNGVMPSNVIYSLTEEPYTGNLWIGTSKGLVIYDNGQLYTLPNHTLPTPTFFNRGATTQLCDFNGNIWISAQPTGLVSVSVRPKNFMNHPLPEAIRDDDMINCISYDRKGNLWMGLERNGLLYIERGSGRHIYMKDMAAMKEGKIPQKINAIYETKSESMFIGTTNDGFIEVSNDLQRAEYTNMSNSGWLPDNCILSFLEDKAGNLFIGTWKGLCIRYTNGKGLRFVADGIKEMESAQIRDITLSKDGTLWLSTKNKGIMRLQGDIHNPKSLRMRIYNTPLNTELPMNDVNNVVQDRCGQIWASSQETGLMLYDDAQDGFVCVNQRYGIPDDDICSLEESKDGNLWISSQRSVMCLHFGSDGKFAQLRYMPNTNEKDENYFRRGISCTDGKDEICFGGISNYVIFKDSPLPAKESATHISITDIRIFNNSLESLEPEERSKVSALLPPYAKEIELSPSQNDITIEFTQLKHSAPQESRFGYKLNGYDKEWIYLADGQHSAHYSNLPAGTYTFLLKATDTNGVWSEETKALQITILPPLWVRWWAIAAYILLLAGIGYFLLRYLKQRELQRRELQLAHIANEKIEELNHKKLQFFTNITHDLMTPLTVIQATVSELEIECPDKTELCQIIQNNLNRQMRLLQQILEFRKAETGNLQLRVSQNDIADFCRKEIESINPLMKRKKLHLSLLCSPEHIYGYFDPDALDKIIYNLLSNAVKYTKPMGYVQVTLTGNEGDGYAQLMIKDNGQGIAANKQADLFKRFYEGEYRKFNTYGTGIGLSLTKDLVTLHHGTISVESKEGEGTLFTVVLPISRNSFSEEEIDDSSPIQLQTPATQSAQAAIPHRGEEQGVRTASAIQGDIENEVGTLPRPEKENGAYTLLIVEDNEDLITLMKQLLEKSYNIVTAYNGKEALDIMENEKIDLIVADVMMPVMNGTEMTRRLRSNPEYSNCPIIMLTAKRTEQDRAEAYESGADAYITKPFHMSVLQARIQNLLKRREKVMKEMKEKLFDGIGDLDITDADEEFLRKCVNCVHKHLSDADFGQQEFADETNTSKSTLYKKLKALTGMNTSAFIRSIRMKAAKEIAERNPNIRISDLAYSVGYNDPKYFSSCFKKDFGVLPSEYLKSPK